MSTLGSFFRSSNLSSSKQDLNSLCLKINVGWVEWTVLTVCLVYHVFVRMSRVGLDIIVEDLEAAHVGGSF
jgi:hypothetical protein